MTPYSLYIHIPFCIARCAYCDFNTYAGVNELIPDYISAICIELGLLVKNLDYKPDIHTIYFGGGTPSLVESKQIEKILNYINRDFKLRSDIEVTIEANPGTVSKNYLRELRNMGINRISLGMQSARPNELKLLERQHNFFDVIDAVDWARKAGIENVNLDLIFGLPGQNLQEWQVSMLMATDLVPDHLSLYSLILEESTPLYSWVQHGLLPNPDEDLCAEMYEWSMDYLDQKGYEQYEISNWARIEGGKKPQVCRHNLQYWYNQPYLGIGAGAHGFTGRLRVANVRGLNEYIHRLHSDELSFPQNFDRYSSSLNAPWSEKGCNFAVTPATSEVNPITPKQEMDDTMLMGLRLTQEGVRGDDFHTRFGLMYNEIYKDPINRMISLGLLEWINAGHEALRLTRRGRLLGNVVFREFV